MTDLVAILMEMRNGQVATDCNLKFNEVLKAVLDTGGKGELTIKLMLKPSKLGMGGAVIEVQASHECKLKKPELAVGSSYLFVTNEGMLTRDNPDQVAMFDEKAERREMEKNDRTGKQ